MLINYWFELTSAIKKHWWSNIWNWFSSKIIELNCFSKKLLLLNWGYQFDWIPLIAEGCRPMHSPRKLLHNDVRSNFFQFVFRNLMQMVNGSFEPVAQLRQFSLLWTNNKAKIRGFFLDDENRDFIKVNIKLHQNLAYFDPSSRTLRPFR